MIFDVSEFQGQEAYRLLTGGVTPRPIAWISTRSKCGADNLAPYSFFTVASCNPPVLLYTQVTQRTGMDKDTLRNLLETHECVVNIVSQDLLEKMNLTSASLGPDESEFNFAQVAYCDSETVSPLSVKDSPVRYECTLRETLQVGDLPTSGTLILLDVKSIYVKDELYKDGMIDQARIDSVGKMGGDGYSSTQNYLALERP